MSDGQWQIGDVTITRLLESQSRTPASGWQPMFVGASVAAVRAAPWLYPEFVTAADEFIGSVGSFLVQTPDQRLVVDTGFGNDKDRQDPSVSHLHTDYLQRMVAAGWPPESVTGVISTHLHVDHVGWHTRLVDGAWVPTFPNAQYYFVIPEIDYWQAYADDPAISGDLPASLRAAFDGEAVYADSIKPVIDAGLARRVAPGAALAPEIRLRSTPGHTPGHSSVYIESRGERAVITGDILHAAAQFAYPDWASVLDTDAEQARQTRRELLTEWAADGVLVLGTHLPPPTAGHVVADGDRFRFATVSESK